jgi:uncharacterized SAM-binding protein YcdF (DUF218 family)
VGKAVTYLGGLLGAILIAVSGGLAIFGDIVTEPRRFSEGSVDGVVVLTGGEHRLQEASRIFMACTARRLLISGVNRQTTREDIRRISTIPAALFDCCVDIGYEALDTVGNAEETRNWVNVWGFSRLVVVTSSYHMPRSLAEFSRAMPVTEFQPHTVTSRGFETTQWWRQASSMRRVITEYVKYIPAVARLYLARAQERFERSVLARAQGSSSRAAFVPDVTTHDTPLGDAAKIR